MKIFTCDICGTDDLVRQGDYFVCQSCGTKYAVDEVKHSISDLLDIKIPKVVEQGMEHVSANDRTALGTSLTKDFSIFTEVEKEVKESKPARKESRADHIWWRQRSDYFKCMDSMGTMGVKV